MTVYDNITFTAASILLVGAMFCRPEIADTAASMLGTFATVYVSVRLGYAAKSGVENYRKIANAMNQTQSCDCNEDYMYEEECSEDENG